MKQRMTAAQRAECDAIFDRVAAENKARYTAEPEPSKDRVEQEAKFLRGWARTKYIVKVGGDDNSFWSCGNRSTQLSPKMVQALVKHEFAELYANGTMLKMKAVK